MSQEIQTAGPPSGRRPPPLATDCGATMRAVVVGERGVRVALCPRPPCGPEDMLVRVRAAALNRADLHVAAGHRHGSSGGIGAIVGIEWAGEIVAVGRDVPPGLAVGDRVMGSGTGAWAEYAVTDWGRVHRLPCPSPAGVAMDHATAATLPIALQTAHEALVDSGGFAAGASVLVQGASSAVGLMCLQLARRLGATLVIGTSTTDSRRSRLAAFGADLALDPGSAGWVDEVLACTGGRGVDLTIDFVAGAIVNANMRATRILGRIVNVGRMGGFHGDFDFDLHSLRRITYVGATFRTRSREEVRGIAARMRADLWPFVEDGSLRLPISRRFALDDAAAALDFMRDNRHFGKVVLEL